MFKVGDRVRSVSTTLSAGLDGTVVRVLPPSLASKGTHIYEVQLDTLVIPTIYFYEQELTPCLPIGNQIPLGSASLILDDDGGQLSLYGMHESMPDYKKDVPKCDCGGFKVYGVLSAEAHSPWCTIFGKKS